MGSAAANVRETLPHLLARRGLRLTGPRRAVLDVLADSRIPLTVPEIHARLGGRQAHIVSVYRTVHMLVRLRLVRPTASLRLGAGLRGSQRWQWAAVAGPRHPQHQHPGGDRRDQQEPGEAEPPDADPA